MDANRSIKIVVAGIVGAVIGSSMGIAAMGDAIAGTVPVGLLASYLMYLWTRKTGKDNSDNVGWTESMSLKSDPSPWEEIGQAAQDAVPILEKAANESVPVLARFFVGLWNLLMKALIAVGIMPVFRKQPWLHAVLIFLLMAAAPYVGVFFLVAAIVAMGKGAKADNDFVVSVSEKAKGGTDGG